MRRTTHLLVPLPQVRAGHQDLLSDVNTASMAAGELAIATASQRENDADADGEDGDDDDYDDDESDVRYVAANENSLLCATASLLTSYGANVCNRLLMSLVPSNS